MSASPLESMPNSLSAEQAVLGGLMLDNCRWDEVADRIVADDFYTSAHREIFSEMERLLSHGKPIDLITLAEALE
ncbi:replicative DNA helicase, partial [Escherichia coli]